MGNKTVVTHKRTKNGTTVCGINLFDVKKSNATFKGVTCKRCLRVKNKKVVKGRTKTKAVASSARAYAAGAVQ